MKLLRKDLAPLHGLPEQDFRRLAAADRALRVAQAKERIAPSPQLRARAMREAFQAWSAGRPGRWLPAWVRPRLFGLLGRRFARRAVLEMLRGRRA